MRQASTVGPIAKAGCMSPALFQGLVLTRPRREAGRKSATFAFSFGLHGALAVAVAIVPLLLSNSMPSDSTLGTFFAKPLEITAAPPPPAPPAGLPRGVRKVASRSDLATRGFSPPADIPNGIQPEDAFGLGIIGGDPNGIDGGVLDSVGLVVDHTLPAAPPPPPKVVRIGQRTPPKLLQKVEPKYPELAIATGVGGRVILEAEVDTAGKVTTVRVLRGHPLLDEAAITAVKQWRYQPLLLNGEPTGFILTVTMDFQIQR